MAYEDRYKEFEQYLASGEPGMEERARNWSMAIGLQDVDRLKPSEFLLEQAKANIEGKISSEEVGKRLEEYYSQKSVLEKAEKDGTFEADRVADRINLLLAEKAFTFSPMELSRIHGFLFKDVLSHAGQFRTYKLRISGFLMEIQSVMVAQGLCRNFLIMTSARRKSLITVLFLLPRPSGISYGSFQESGRFMHLAKATPARLRCSLSSI